MLNKTGWANAIATCFRVGYWPYGPGTLATILCCPMWWGLHAVGHWGVYVGVWCFLLGLGYWATSHVLRVLRQHDPSEIVIDEVLGLGVTLIMPVSHPLLVLLGVVLFRILDIAKPWPIGFVDRRVPGALGVILDDLVAGGFALIGVQLAQYWLY